MSYIPIECHFNDHRWNGSICSDCGARLRCSCGCFIRAENIEAHMNSGKCRFINSLPNVDSAAPREEGTNE